MEIRAGTVDLGPVEMHFVEAGDGLPVVLVHAGIADGRMWELQAEALAKRYRVVVPDLRGFGRTPVAEGQFTNYGDLARLGGELGLTAAAWVGASMGGTAVLDLALTRPDLVAAIVDIGGVPSGFEVTDEATIAGWDAAADAYDAGDFEEAARIELNMWVIGDERDPAAVGPDIRTLVTEMLLDSYEAGDGESNDLEPGATKLCGEITQPTLIVVGEQDRPDTVRGARYLAGEIPWAILRVIPGAAHLPNLERPDLVNDLLLEFLADSYPP